MIKEIDFIQESNKEYEKVKRTFKASNGKSYEISICKKIKNTIIMEIVDDLLKRSEMCKNEKIKFDIVLSTYALLIKHLTDIQFKEFKQVKKQFIYEVDMIKALLDLGLLEQILKELEPGEVDKISESFKDYSYMYKKINHNIISKEIGTEENKK